MSFRLSDVDVANIRAMAGEGHSLQEIAEQFGTSRQHVWRLVRNQQRQDLPDPTAVLEESSVVAAVRATLEGAGWSAEEDVRAATAIALAEKLDSVRATATANGAMAAPGLARALHDTLSELHTPHGGDFPRLGALRGEEAVLVARELGYPEPELIDVDRFDEVEALRAKRHRRLAAQRAVNQS